MQLWCKDGVYNVNFIQTVQIKIRTGCNNLVLPNRNTYLMGTEDVINIQGSNNFLCNCLLVVEYFTWLCPGKSPGKVVSLNP